jgi:CubicO group peptidase (beta-lactamase class C family)
MGSKPRRVIQSWVRLVCPVFILLLSRADTTAARATASDFAPIDQYIAAEMQRLRLPGLALAIVHGDQIVHLRGFGVADPSGRPVTPQTPFLIASLTKSFTALAVMQLVEAGKVDLDSPVQRYLPAFRVADVEASARITVRHLLTMTGGLPASTGDEYQLLRRPPTANDLALRVDALQSVRLVAPPGAVFEYSNAGYATLALLVESVSAQSYAEYLQQHIYGPLQMRQSFVSQSLARAHGLATGYRYWFGFPVPFDWSYNHAELGAGFTNSSADDLARYLIPHLNGGRYAKAQLLSPQGIAALHRPAAPFAGPFGEEFYAMGWMVRDTNGVRLVSHSGVAPHFHADLVLVPEGRWGIALLTNADNRLHPAAVAGLATGVAGLLVGKELSPPLPATDFYPTLLSIILAISVFQLIGIVWSIVTLRHWRAHPDRRPRDWRRLWHILPSLGLNLLWGLVSLVGLPLFLRWPLDGLLLEVPDFGTLLVLSGTLALVWGLVRAALLVRMLRAGSPRAVVHPAPDTPATSRRPVM